jgi:hypothetical protein
MARSSIQRISKAIQVGAYRLTGHGESEREADAISRQEIEEALKALLRNSV